jgi:hypothetical protein
VLWRDVQAAVHASGCSANDAWLRTALPDLLRGQVRFQKQRTNTNRDNNVVEEVFLCCCGFAAAARFPIDASQVGGACSRLSKWRFRFHTC